MKKIVYTLGTVAIVGSLLTGCGKKEEETTTEITTEATTEAVTEATVTDAETTPLEAEEELLEIGHDEAGAFKIKLTNGFGQDVTAVAVKNVDADEWSENMLSEGDSFANGESRYFYLCSDAEAETKDYAVMFTLADETTVTLTVFPYDEMTVAEVSIKDEVGFVEYDTEKESGLSTLEAEIEAKEQREAEEAAAAAAAAAAQQQQQSTPQPTYDDSGDDCLGDGLTY